MRAKCLPVFKEMFGDLVGQLVKLEDHWKFKKVVLPWEALQGVNLHQQLGRVAASWTTFEEKQRVPVKEEELREFLKLKDDWTISPIDKDPADMLIL